MNPDYEEKYHRFEESHWWLRARRDLVLALSRQLQPDNASRVLEIGCSSGVLLRRFKSAGYKSVVGIDISEDAIQASHRLGSSNASVMDAQKLNFADASFDLITASDVLEHIADDVAALHEWARVLAPGGRAILFVPAFQELWSEHDLANQHFRRYRVAELAAKAQAAGLIVSRRSYWNALLFTPVAILRALRRLTRRGGVGVADRFFPPPAAPLNAALFAILTLENTLLRWGMNFPFGISAMIVARKE